MSGLVRRGGSKTKRLVKSALVSVGPSPDLIIELAELRRQVQANTNHIDDLSKQLAALLGEIELFRTARGDFLPGHMPLSDLGPVVTGLGERVHSHEQELREIKRKIERFGGSVLDEMALDRRLRKIEDILNTDADPHVDAE